MELLTKTISDPGAITYLSGVFLVILGAIVGIATPDTRKNLHTIVAIPLFVATGVSTVFHSFNLLANRGHFAVIHALMYFIAFVCATEVGRLNFSKAFNRKTFSAYWYVAVFFVFLFLSWKYNESFRLLTLLLVLFAKLFGAGIALMVTKEISKPARPLVNSCFYIAIAGSICQFIVDLSFIKVVDDHYLPMPGYCMGIYLLQTLLVLVMSVIILKRRYDYESNHRVHAPNMIILFSPSAVFVTSIIASIFVLFYTKYLTEQGIVNNITQFWLLFIILFVIGILYTVLYGVTLNCETLKAAETAQTNFKRIFDSASFPICVIDADTSEILQLNRGMEEHFGYGSGMVGQKLCDFVSSEKKFDYDIHERTESVRSECVFKKASGEFFTAEVTASLLETQYEKRFVLICIHDITMFKAIEENLIRAKNSAEEANQLKNRFFANTSHEIRTPMTAIIGLTELAVSVCYNENQRKIIELLRFSSKSLMSLINDIFDLTEAKNGKLTITNTTFKLKNLLDEVFSYSKFHAQRENTTVDFNLSKNLPKYICSDFRHLQQILLILLNQSTEYCEGSVHIAIDFLEEKENRGYLVFRTSKILSEKRQEIESSMQNEFGFNPYEASSSRKLCVGISLTNLIIDAMGGTIFLHEESENDDYIEIEIRVPVEVNDSITVEEPEEKAVESKYLYSYGKPVSFLIADDNDVNLFLAESIVTRFNGKCYCVKNGLEVLEILKNHRFDIILLDIQMPKLDGMKVLEEKRKMSKEVADIPVIAISAFASMEEKEKALKLGATSYLSKPYFPYDLIKTVDSIIPLDKSLPATAGSDLKENAITACVSSDEEKASDSQDSPEQQLQNMLKRINYADFKNRIAPKPGSMKQLIDIYNRRYAALDIGIDDSINENDSARLREVAHSIKGLVGMMSANNAWEIAKNIEKLASEGKMDEAIARIGELRLNLAEIADDLVVIEKFLKS